ncbi:MAG: deiodinase-like protein [Acidobacteriota bacterium]
MEIKEDWVRNFYNMDPHIGTKAPDFTLDTIAGGKITLYEALKKRPVVLEFGNYTCPPFRNRTASIEKVKQKWGNRVEFIVVYTRESNPNHGPFQLIKEPSSQKERNDLAQLMVEELNSSMTVSVDKMDNRVCRIYGEPFSASFIIKQDGTVFYKGPWTAPAKIDTELTRMFGGKPAQRVTHNRRLAVNPAMLNIKGMVCQGCVIAVRHALVNVAGVQSVDVDLSTHKATIKHDGTTRLSDLILAVKDTGFGVTNNTRNH